MHICRTRFKKDIIAEFIPPKDLKSKKVMIFCAGVPGAPYKDDVLEFFSKKGYWTFFPRFRGTWESTGFFLKDSPDKDVIDVIDSLTQRFEDYWTHKKYRVKPTEIVVVGSSFGGPAAILASRDPRVNKVVCISPVVDWQAENKTEPLDVLYRFLGLAFPGAYRVNKRDWNKLAKGRFYNPAYHIRNINGSKLLIFHAIDDKIVRFKPVEKFARVTGSELVTLNKGGHLSSSMLMEGKFYRKLKHFLADSDHFLF